jgi:acetone carboxylase gamma subunit
MTYTKKKVGAAPKKKAAKKSSSYHKDTKSHNVNIRVMSGTKDFSGKILDQLNETLNRISNAQEAIDKLKIGLKYKQFSKEDIPEARKRVKKYTEYMKGLKNHFRELKKQFS